VIFVSRSITVYDNLENCLGVAVLKPAHCKFIYGNGCSCGLGGGDLFGHPRRQSLRGCKIGDQIYEG